MAERITFTTTDDVTIVGDWSPAATMVGAVILLHMMPMTRASWAVFIRTLNKNGLGALAIDLRGHGESTEGPGGVKLDYKEFDDESHASSVWDVSGAVDWVRARGIELTRMALVGASFGANLCLRELGEEPTLTGAVLLSPGEDYRGIRALEDAQRLEGGQRLLILASEEDTDAYQCSQKLYEQAPVRDKTFLPYKGAGHGSSMFNADPKLMDKAAAWLKNSMTGV